MGKYEPLLQRVEKILNPDEDQIKIVFSDDLEAYYPPGTIRFDSQDEGLI